MHRSPQLSTRSTPHPLAPWTVGLPGALPAGQPGQVPVPARVRRLLGDTPVAVLHAPAGFGAATLAESVASAAGDVVVAVAGDHHWTVEQILEVHLRLPSSPPPRLLLVSHSPLPHPSLAGVPLLTAADLALRPDELLAAIRTVEDAGTDAADDAAELHRATHGWPALVGAVLDARRRSGPAYDDLAATQALRDHLRSSVLPWLPDAWEACLTHLAVAGEASLEEIDRHPDTAVAAALPALVQLGLVRTFRHLGRPAVALLPELARLLDDDLRRRDPDRRRAVLSGIADARIRSGALDGGLRAAHALGDLDRCAASLDRWWVEQAFHGHLEYRNAVLCSLPEPLLRRSPRLAEQAMIAGALPADESGPDVPDDAGVLRELARSGRARAQLETAALAVMRLRMHGSHAAASRIVERAAPLVAVTAREHVGAGAGFGAFWHLQAGLTAQLGGDDEGAAQQFRRGWLLRDHDDTGFAASDLLARQALLAALRGESATAGRWIAAGRAEGVPASWVAPHTEAAFGLAERIVRLDGADPADLASWRTGVELAYDSQILWPWVVALELRLAIADGHPRTALQVLDELQALRPHDVGSDGVHGPLVAALRAEAHLALGHGTSAAQALAGPPHPVQRVARTRAHLLAGDAEAARSLALRAAADPACSPRERTELGLLRAAAEAALGLVDATATVTAAARLAAERGDRRVLLSLPEGAWRELAARHDGVAEQVAVLTAAGLAPAYPDAAVRVELTERERVVLDGIAQGWSTDDIAGAEFVSRNTVKTQIRSLFAKLGAHSRAEALTVADGLGLLGGRVARPAGPSGTSGLSSAVPERQVGRPRLAAHPGQEP